MKTIILALLCSFIITSINAQAWQTVFYDDFNRADGALGINYNIAPIANVSLGIVSNEVEATPSSDTAYWTVKYVNSVSYDSIRISCIYNAPNLGYAFSLNARDNGTNTYGAGIYTQLDSIVIVSRDYIGNSTTLAKAKANLDTTKTYYMEFTLLHDFLTFKFVSVGAIDTITINATDNTLTGDYVSLSCYHYSNSLLLFDNFKIESFENTTSIVDLTRNIFSVFPNPASNFVTVNADRNSNTVLTIYFYNVMGKLVRTETLQQNQQQIDIRDLDNGIYMVEIKSKEWTGKQKLIIQR